VDSHAHPKKSPSVLLPLKGRLSGRNPKQFASRSSDVVYSRFVPAGRGLLFAFPEAVAETFDHGQVGVVQEAIQERGDASRVWKDVVPRLGRKDNTILFTRFNQFMWK
jgi:hypothetical protein